MQRPWLRAQLVGGNGMSDEPDIRAAVQDTLETVISCVHAEVGNRLVGKMVEEIANREFRRLYDTQEVLYVDCVGLPANHPAHEGKWDTKNGHFRDCSWCGVVHPDDDTQ